MKKILFLFWLLLLIIPVESQVIRASAAYNNVPAAAPPAGATYTDDFEGYDNGSLVDQGSWIGWTPGAIQVYDWGGETGALCYGGASSAISGIAYDDAFENDQYAEIVIDDIGSDDRIGVGVRMTGSALTSDGYAVYVNDVSSLLVRVDDGVPTTLATGNAYAIGNVLKLEVSGSVLSVYKNGSLDTSIDTDGHVTDATYSSGNAGVVGYNDTAECKGDDWEGGDL